MLERSAFLDLPPELRIAIYHAVIHAAVDIPHNGDNPKKQDNAMSSAIGTHTGPRHITPWCTLMLTCRQIATEMQQHMAKPMHSTAKEKTTWTIELGSSQGSYALEPKCIRLPCPPSQTRIIRLETPLMGLENAWGIARVLIQTVSLLLRRGPTLDTTKQSNPAHQVPLSIREIHLAFVGFCSESQRRYGLPENVVHCFRTMRQQHAVPGASSIETITLIDEYYEQAWSTISGREK